MKRLTPVVLALTVLATSCSDDDITRSLTPVGGLDLQNPEVGSSSQYALYEGDCSGNFRLTGDTLNIQVVTSNDTLFLRESYTTGSTREIEPTDHPIFPKGAYSLIPGRFVSEFLFFYGNDTIFFDRDPSVNLIQDQCRLLEDGSNFIGDAIGQVDSFQFGPVSISDQKAISCIPTLLALEAYIFYQSRLEAIHIIGNRGDDTVTGFLAIE